MAEQKNHINFSLADIERYLQGRMLPKEMHDLEKAALQDPFLADAIEGYSQVSSEVSNKHLNEIAAALQATQESKVVPIVHKSTIQWWKVAAIVIVIIGAGSASWLFLKQNNAPNEIVQTQKKVVPATPQEQAQQPPFKVDTIGPAFANVTKPTTIKAGNNKNQLALSTTEAITAGLTSTKNNDTKERWESTQLNQQTDSGNELAKSYKVAPDSLTLQNMANAETKLATAYQYNLAAENAARKKTESYYDMKQQRQAFARSAPAATLPPPSSPAPVSSFQLKGRVLSGNAQPVPSALVKVVNGNAATITDDQGYFTLYSPDSTSLVNVSSAGFVAKESNLRSGTPNTIALKEDAASLSEVVVMELNSRKEAKDKTIGTDTKSKEPYPEKGWPSFQEYVYTKLHKEHEYDSTYAGTVLGGKSVELEFMVDANGTPYNFKVVHSVDEASDKKAIEIVKQGPRWIATGKKGKKAKVVIKL